MAMRKNYWSCTKFADWVRGTKKSGAMTGRGWQEWETEAKAKHPIRYWLAEEFLDSLQNFINWPLDKLYDIKYFLNNRFISRSHALVASKIHIVPGKWCDLANRFLPCMFDSLVDFVEVECAWKNIAWDKEARQKFNPPFYAWGWFRWRVWRSPEAGIDYLTWAKNLVLDETWAIEKDDDNYGKPTHQAIAAAEILELYNWWTKIYPERKDPHDASGWTDFCAKRREQGHHFLDMEYDQDDQQRSKEILDLCQKIEDEYNREDEEMMIRLIKVRHNLWT